MPFPPPLPWRQPLAMAVGRLQPAKAGSGRLLYQDGRESLYCATADGQTRTQKLTDTSNPILSAELS